MYIIDVDDEISEKLKFTWECIDFTQNEMVLQLYFENPKFVSISDKPQTLKLVFNGEATFMDLLLNVVRPGFELRRVLPR